MAQLQIWSNPWLAMEYSLQIDLDTGKAFYQTNFINGRMQNYECFFLVGREACQSIANTLHLLVDWRAYYGDPEQLCVDGYRWRITVIDDGERTCRGDNGKPHAFVAFLAAVESAVQKTLSSEKGHCTY